MRSRGGEGRQDPKPRYGMSALLTALGFPGKYVEGTFRVHVVRAEAGEPGEVYRLTEEGTGKVGIWPSSVVGVLKEGERVRLRGKVANLTGNEKAGYVTALTRCRVIHRFEETGGANG